MIRLHASLPALLALRPMQGRAGQSERRRNGMLFNDAVFFYLENYLCSFAMALGSTQPLVKMSTRNIRGGKGSRCVRLTTYHHTVPLSRNLGALTLLDPSGPAWPVTGVLFTYVASAGSE